MQGKTIQKTIVITTGNVSCRDIHVIMHMQIAHPRFFYPLSVVLVVINVVVMFDQSSFNGYMIGEKKDVVYIITNYPNCT